jgi:hypothetical protein
MRWYYEDALGENQAKWMEVAHGFTFASWPGGSGKYYISEESLPLLEPREGDVGIMESENDAVDGMPVYFTDLEWCVITLDGYQGIDQEDMCPVRIIQRDSKAFHWPQHEEAPNG